MNSIWIGLRIRLLLNFFTGKSCFPYAKINKMDLNITRVPHINDFLGNFLSKAKDEQDERKQLQVPFENIIKMWNLLNLKNYGQLLHIYNIIDTISLSFVLYDFDNRIFQELGLFFK